MITSSVAWCLTPHRISFTTTQVMRAMQCDQQEAITLLVALWNCYCGEIVIHLSDALYPQHVLLSDWFVNGFPNVPVWSPLRNEWITAAQMVCEFELILPTIDN